MLDYGADTVVVATGSAWMGDGSQPHHLERIAGAGSALTPEQVMTGARPAYPGGRVVVYDTDGYYVAPGIAELLVAEGYETHLVTTKHVVSPVSDESLEGDMLRRHLHRLGVVFHTGRTLLTIEAGEVSGETELGDPWRLPADGVVLVTQQRSESALYDALVADPAALAAAGIRAVHRVGDAVAPRMPSESVFDGHRLGRELESTDPDVPLPFLRERPTV